MNSLMKRFLLCPVPDDQKPINQYIEGKENPLTNWLFQQPKIQQKKITNILFLSFLTSFVLQFQTKVTTSIIITWLTSSFLLCYLFLLVFLLNTLFRWKEIVGIFQKSSVIYEEASWFDTQYWEKPFFLIKNDTFLATQKLRPQLQQLSKKTAKIFLSALILFILLNLFKIPL